MSLAKWNKGEFGDLTQTLFEDLKKSGKERLGYLVGQYFSIGKSYRGRITEIDIDLSSESKSCDVYIVAIFKYINKKGKEVSMRYRLNDWHWRDDFIYAEDEDSLKLFLEMKDK